MSKTRQASARLVSPMTNGQNAVRSLLLPDGAKPFTVFVTYAGGDEVSGSAFYHTHAKDADAAMLTTARIYFSALVNDYQLPADEVYVEIQAVLEGHITPIWPTTLIISDGGDARDSEEPMQDGFYYPEYDDWGEV